MIFLLPLRFTPYLLHLMPCESAYFEDDDENEDDYESEPPLNTRTRSRAGGRNCT